MCQPWGDVRRIEKQKQKHSQRLGAYSLVGISDKHMSKMCKRNKKGTSNSSLSLKLP